MIFVRPFNFLCFEFWDNDEPIVRVSGTDYYQLRLRGYFKGTPMKDYERKQTGVRNGTAYMLINGFSICGRREQLEYLKAYISKSIERTKINIYNHKIADIPFEKGKLNIGYAFGRRSVYGYVFNFNFQRWLERNDLQIDKNILKELEPKFLEIYNEFEEERNQVQDIYDKHYKRVCELKLQDEWDKFNNACGENIDGAIERFIEEFSDRTASEINEMINAQKINLDI